MTEEITEAIRRNLLLGQVTDERPLSERSPIPYHWIPGHQRAYESRDYPAPAPPFCAAGRAVGLDDGAVDEKQTVLTILGKRIEDRLPYAEQTSTSGAVA